MPRRTTRDHERDDDDEWDESGDYDAYRDYDPENPDTYPEGLYADDGPPVVPCPHCRAEISEEAERCPRCGMYVSKEDAPPAPKTNWWVVGVVLGLLATLFWVAGR